LLVVAVATCGLLGYGFYRLKVVAPPEITLAKPLTRIGTHSTVRLNVDGARHGIGALRVTIVQSGTEHLILGETYPHPKPHVSVEWTPSDEKRFELAEGPGHLHVEAAAPSFLKFKGRTASLDQDFTAVLKPPRLELLTSQHRVSQGGCELLAYRVDPADVESGVVVGDHFFRGYPVPGATSPAIQFAIFAFPYDLPPHSPIRLRARDSASNETLTNVTAKVVPKAPRKRKIELKDDFLNRVDAEILSHTPSVVDTGDALKNFLQINGTLRRANNDFLGGLAARSRPEFLWTDSFQQLGNSEVEAHFADHRVYSYGGQDVDQQDHLGYDLATTEHAPVSASNDGVVLFADFLGIYGNTIVLDHGYGLMSLYGHLSSIDVAVGGAVKRGDVIGHSGSTGLAGGDHLHFSMILQGVQVDPKEWWDPHWIRDRLTSKLDQFNGKEPPPPSPPPPPAPKVKTKRRKPPS
jgi:murein DD-endopeptidase MepM/ murein hydrolase activator NlpD